MSALALWFVGQAFDYTRRAGALLILGLLLNACPSSCPGSRRPSAARSPPPPIPVEHLGQDVDALAEASDGDTHLDRDKGSLAWGRHRQKSGSRRNGRSPSRGERSCLAPPRPRCAGWIRQPTSRRPVASGGPLEADRPTPRRGALRPGTIRRAKPANPAVSAACAARCSWTRWLGSPATTGPPPLPVGPMRCEIAGLTASTTDAVGVIRSSDGFGRARRPARVASRSTRREVRGRRTDPRALVPAIFSVGQGSPRTHGSSKLRPLDVSVHSTVDNRFFSAAGRTIAHRGVSIDSAL